LISTRDFLRKLIYRLEEDFSLPRNPIIAKIFRFVRLAESIGSGFHKMINGWEQHYGLEPVIEGDFKGAMTYMTGYFL